jgi:hypothetical protein
MSSARQYFALAPKPGTPHTCYAVIERGVVVEILVSRPDGIEIERPAEYRVRLRPFVGGPLAAPGFGTVRGEALAKARLRAGEKAKRLLAERRTLMSTATDAALAAARSRGADKLHLANAARRVRKAA